MMDVDKFKETFGRMNAKELKDELRKRNARTTGKKEELFKRLIINNNYYLC